MNTSKRANSLQFLRFCAFMLIFMYHAENYSTPWYIWGENGAANAVEFFFILSGFVSGYSSYHSEINCTARDVLRYIWKKIKKLYPLYIVTTLFTVSYSKLPIYIASSQFYKAFKLTIHLIVNALLLQSWFPHGSFSFNGVGWFLSTIFFLYCVNLPLKYLLTKISKGKRRSFYICVALLAYLIDIAYCFLTRETNMEYTQYVLPISRLGEYICGLSLGYFVSSINYDTTKESDRKIFFTIIEIAVLGLWCINMSLPVKIRWMFRIIRWMLPNCLLICTFGIGKGYISSWFSLSIPCYLGNISFECFLIHQILIYIYRLCSGVENPGCLGKLFSLMFCICITVAIASLVSHKKIKQ